MVTNEAPPRHFTIGSDVLAVNDVIRVPAGFQATKFAQLSDAATESTAITVLTLGPDGKTFYVLTLDGRIFTLQDTDGDNVADKMTPVFTNANQTLNYAVGMAFHDGIMYISDGGRVGRLEDSDNDGMYDAYTPIARGFPTQEYVWHSNNGIAFGPDNKLYLAIGATSDHGPIKEKQESMILRMNPDGSDMEVVATGFRNPYDLTFSPKGELFTADNGPDTGPAGLPGNRWVEELDYIRPGRDYGFPRVFGFPPPGDNSEPPVTEFLPHTASAGLVYYAATQFPEHYRNGIFVAQWGGSQDPNGHMVVFVPLTPTGDGRYKGDWEPFATFDISTRPVDVTVGPDGALYIAEWTRGWIFRVAYTG
jgi:putative membrane-bound dehydrogenase-like protein